MMGSGPGQRNADEQEIKRQEHTRPRARAHEANKPIRAPREHTRPRAHEARAHEARGKSPF